MPFLPLLLACDLLLPARPEPLLLSVPLPTATHTESITARQLVAPLPVGDVEIQEVSEADVSAYCDWASGASSDDRIAKKLLAKGLLSYTILEASASGVRLGGREIIALDGGRVPADEQKGRLITRVYDRLLEHAEASKALGELCPGADFTGQLGLALAPDLPYEAAVSLMYTAGQAQFGTFFMLVDGPPGPAYTTKPEPAADRRQVLVRLSGDQATAAVGQQERSGPAGSLSSLVGEAASGQGVVGCGLIVPDAATVWQGAVAAMDAVAGQGATKLVLAGAPSDDEGAPIAPTAPGTLAISLETVLPLIASELPVIGPPTEEDGGECGMLQVARAQPLTPAAMLGQLGQLGSADIQTVRASVTDGELVVGDGLDRALVEAVLRRRLSQIKYCYERELVKAPELQGTVTIAFSIDGEGRVGEAAVASSSLGSDEAAQCVVSRFERMRFPAPRGGAVVKAEKTYTFTPASGE